MTDDAYIIEGQNRPSRWLVTCDHARNRVPEWINGGNLGITSADMNRHIAYDVGAEGVARALAEHLDAPAIHTNFSRLVIDPNRGADDPTLIMRLYDGTVIPANKHHGPSERTERLTRLYHPYHDALEKLASARPERLICAIHSFTPRLHGRTTRPWQVGILYSHKDERLGPAMIQACREQGWITGDNEPYSGHLDGDSIDQHALAHGRPNLLIELRNDLIATPEGQAEWAARLAPVLTGLIASQGV